MGIIPMLKGEEIKSQRIPKKPNNNNKKKKTEKKLMGTAKLRIGKEGMI